MGLYDTSNTVRDGLGGLYSKDGSTFLSFDEFTHNREYTIKEGTKVIGSAAFAPFLFNYDDEGYSPMCIYCPFTKINIPDSVEEIGCRAFYNCKDLQEVNLPKNLTMIKKLTFDGCTSLEHIELPETLLSIGESAFRDCRNLKTVVLPASLIAMEKEIFWWCETMKYVFMTIPKTVGFKQFERDAFSDISYADKSRLLPATW